MKLYPILITLLNSKEILDTEEKVLRYIRSVDEGDAQEVFHSETAKVRVVQDIPNYKIKKLLRQEEDF